MSETDWFDEVEKEMAEDTSNDADVWDPKPGEILKGYFLKASVNRGGDYGPSLMILVKEIGKDGATYKLFCNRKMLLDGVLAVVPKQGSMFSVKFEGEKEPKKEGGRKFFGYVVRAKESDPAYWAVIAQDLYRKPDHQVATPTQFGPDEVPF